MERVQSHRDLVVWQKAIDLVVGVYRVSALFPASERWRLVDQVSRAVVSVPTLALLTEVSKMLGSLRAKALQRTR